MPTASIVMAVYNGSRFLPSAIDSVVQQTVSDWELLIADDHSSDSSVELVESRARLDPRIRLIRLGQNSGGPARPRNRALTQARGEVCFFIDQDDVWAPHKLEMQLAKFETGSFGLVYSDALVQRPGEVDARYSDLWGPMAEGDVTAELFARCFVPALTAAVPREVVRAVGELDETLAGVDDYDYWIRIALAGYRVGYVDEPLATWTVTETSLSHQRVQQLERARRCLARYSASCPEYRSVIEQHRNVLGSELLAARRAGAVTGDRHRWVSRAVGAVRRMRGEDRQ